MTSSTTSTTATSTSTSTTTTVPPSTTTTLSAEDLAAAEYESDVDAIQQLFRGHSDAWMGGQATAVEYLLAHNHPLEECSGEDWESFYSAVGEGYQEDLIVDAATVERDDGWNISGGPGTGQVPEGRIYIFTLTGTFGEPGFEQDVRTEAHAVVSGDNVFYFVSCETS